MDMNRCCGCDEANKCEERTSGHVFDCQHFLCERCLKGFSDTPLRTVCFGCVSPPVVDPSLSPFDNTPKDSQGKAKTINTGSIVDDLSSKCKIPSELIYDRSQLEITDISLSGGTAEKRGRMEEDRVPSPRRKTAHGGIVSPLSGPLSNFALVLREKKKELEAAEKAFKEQGTTVRNQIETHAQMCRALIDRDEKRLLQQLNEMMETALSENSTAISNIWRLIQRLEKAAEEDEETDDVEQLLTTRIGTSQFKDVSVHLTDDIYPPEEKNFVGELNIQPQPDHSSFLPGPVLIGSIPDHQHRAVTGVTALDREIFITHDSSPEVSVYSAMTNAFLRSLSLLHLLEPIVIPSPVDLASSSSHSTRSIYVADGSNNYIFRLRPDGKLIHWWPVDNLRGLSVTTTGTVLVGSGKAIKEYDPNGRVVRSISMSPLGSLFRGRPSTKRPTHFLETDNGHVVICDFTTDTPKALHVVYDVDRKGNAVTRWHGNRADSGDEFLNEPRHLAIAVTGHVMVVDRRNDRVKLLDAELKFVKDLIREGGCLKRPQRLHYDPARGLLYVGLVAGDTLVYRVTL